MRLTVRYEAPTDEIKQIKNLVAKEYYDDLFAGDKRGIEPSMSIIETMGADKKVVGFVVIDNRLGRGLYYHGYSLVTNQAVFNKSDAVATQWVKKQSK